MCRNKSKVILLNKVINKWSLYYVHRDNAYPINHSVQQYLWETSSEIRWDRVEDWNGSQRTMCSASGRICPVLRLFLRPISWSPASNRCNPPPPPPHRHLCSRYLKFPPLLHTQADKCWCMWIIHMTSIIHNIVHVIQYWVSTVSLMFSKAPHSPLHIHIPTQHVITSSLASRLAVARFLQVLSIAVHITSSRAQSCSVILWFHAPCQWRIWKSNITVLKGVSCINTNMTFYTKTVFLCPTFLKEDTLFSFFNLKTEVLPKWFLDTHLGVTQIIIK